MEVDSEESDDHPQINIYSCYNGIGLKELLKSATNKERILIESFISTLSSKCSCILYFFLTEGIYQLDNSFYNVLFSATFLRFKDFYELNCPAKYYSQAVAL